MQEMMCQITNLAQTVSKLTVAPQTLTLAPIPTANIAPEEHEKGESNKSHSEKSEQSKKSNTDNAETAKSTEKDYGSQKTEGMGHIEETAEGLAADTQTTGTDSEALHAR
jgi:hypothetical protein